jgi:hemerythrin-like metal-binding protein
MMLQHFRDEESILEQACFPHVQEHRADHEKLLTKIAKLSEAFTRDRLSLESFFRLLAHDVIYRHLLEADHDYFAFINPHFPIEP